MRKLFALYQNEMYKILVNPGVFIFAVIIAVSGFVTPILTRTITLSLDSPSIIRDESALINDLEKSQIQIETAKDQLLFLQSEDASAEELDPYLRHINYYEYRIAITNYRIENEFFDFSEMGFLNIVIDMIYNFRQMRWDIIEEVGNNPTHERAGLIDQIDKDIRFLFNILETKDFSSYINFSNELIDSPYIDFSQNRYPSNIMFFPNEIFLLKLIEESNLIYRIDPETGFLGNNEFSATRIFINYYLEQKSFLDHGFTINISADHEALIPLDEQTEKALLDEIAILEYRFDNEQLNVHSSYKYSEIQFPRDTTTSVGLFFVTLITIVLAGSSISLEFSQGSIKSLIISPVRRWKIYTAKYLSLLTTVCLGVIIVWLFSNIGYGIFYGMQDTCNYVFIFNGNTFSVPFHIFHLIQLLVSSINIIVFVTFALMLSVITKNTGVSTAVAMGMSFLSMRFSFLFTATLVETRLRYKPWMDFIPFNNFDLVAQLFPYERLIYNPYLYSNLKFFDFSKPSLLFSVIYIIVLLAVMFYIGLDSFTRKDIK